MLNDSDTYVTSLQNVVPKVAFPGRRPPLHLDPPDHTPYRAILNPLLTPERVDEPEAKVREFTVRRLAPLIAAGRADICQEFASHVPVRVVGHWMQLPPELESELGQAGPDFTKAVQRPSPKR